MTTDGIFSQGSVLAPTPSKMDALIGQAPLSLQAEEETGGIAGNERKRWAMHRSMSSPNVRSLALGDAAGYSSADKRRNKLGYHRTAVACGHCRKRKIRCVMSNDDTVTRCQNCIRLKKECRFFPVDHPPNFTKKSKSGSSKTEAPSTDAETSNSPSSPGAVNGVMDGFDEPNLRHFDIQTPEDPYHPPRPFATPDTNVSAHSISHDPSTSFQTQSSWQSTPFLSQSPRPPDPQQHFETTFPPVDTNFANHWVMGPPGTFEVHDQMSSPVFQYGWQQGQIHPRSMSIGSPEIQNYNHTGHPIPHPHLRRSFTYHPESAFGAVPQAGFPPLASQPHSTPTALHHHDSNSPWQMVSPSLPSNWTVSAAEYLPNSAVEHPSPWLPSSSQGLPNVKEEEFQHAPRPP